MTSATATDKWIIWSNEHRAYWRPDSCGYTRRIDDAGRYSYEEARSICFPPHFRGGSNQWPPPEMMFPEPIGEIVELTREHFEKRRAA